MYELSFLEGDDATQWGQRSENSPCEHNRRAPRASRTSRSRSRVFFNDDHHVASSRLPFPLCAALNNAIAFMFV